MARFSFAPTFVKEVIMIFRERPLKEIIFGKHVELDQENKNLLDEIKRNENNFRAGGGCKGSLVKINIAHKGEGDVYLAPVGNKSVLVFSENTKIIPGPDLYVYLSNQENPRNGIGEILNLGLLKGTKGGQVYNIDVSVTELQKYKTVVIYCKQFEVLFSFAVLK